MNRPKNKRSSSRKPIALLLLLLFTVHHLQAWGFLGHKTINKQAVFALPQPLFEFYKSHIDFLTEHAIDPDQRRYTDTAEACRHYIDLERYEKAMPIDTIPKFWKQAVEKAKSTEVDKVIAAMAGQTFKAPSGIVSKMDEKNHHLHKSVFIGEVKADGQFNVVWKTPGPVKAKPWSPYIEGNDKKPDEPAKK